VTAGTRQGASPRRLAGVLASLVLLYGCAGSTRAPIEHKEALPAAHAGAPRVVTPAPIRKPAPRPPVHVVVAGDTLHAIAWRYGLDYRDLVSWNRLANPDLIVVGQRLHLHRPASERAAGVTPDVRTARTPPKGAALAAPATTTPTPVVGWASPVDATRATAVEGVRWVWPTQGATKTATSINGFKGIEIRGARGQAVNAAAAGTVVYSGSGLRGYGELIIIKHNEIFLSAYAHNDARLVQEGGQVDGGQMIARMGNSDSQDVMLHFEIRRNGKAVNPLNYLPRR